MKKIEEFNIKNIKENININEDRSIFVRGCVPTAFKTVISVSINKYYVHTYHKQLNKKEYEKIKARSTSKLFAKIKHYSFIRKLWRMNL
jgi:hypothetical protein